MKISSFARSRYLATLHVFFITGIIGAVFFTIFYESSIKVAVFSFTCSAVIGSVLSLYLSFIEPYLKRLRIIEAIIINLISISAILTVLSTFFVLIFFYSGLNPAKIDFIKFFTDKGYLTGMIYGFSLTFIFTFLRSINQILGRNVLLNLVIGTYHSPKEENRIFMFLDLKSSTSIAESIGDKRFVDLINDFFFDISEGILATNGEVYKYVGDEAIISWSIKKGVKNFNALRCYFIIRQSMKRKQNKYFRKYGVVPEFKAGIHCGHVIRGEIGILKKEITYLGDVLNTTARIESLCNEKGENFLASDDVVKLLAAENEFEIKSIGSMMLRGKQNPVGLFAVHERES